MDTTIDVTKNLSHSAPSTHLFTSDMNRQLDMKGVRPMGIYHHQKADRAPIEALKALYRSAFAEEPALLLILDDDHKGRIDAHLYAGSDHHRRINLDMIEDGPLYPAVMTR
ncbi:hypothetical protein [Mariprofundus erugo]|nr:hypothetical protein [Mariprofundus erugo]